MASAPPPNDRARTDRLQLARLLGAGAVLVLLAAAVWGGVTLLVPADGASAETVEVIGPEYESVEIGAVAGMRRFGFAAASPLRAAERDLAGFSDPVILAEIADELAALDVALEGGDAETLRDAVARIDGTAPALIERVLVDAEARIAAGSSADAGVIQAAWDASGAIRSVGVAASGGEFATMRAAVEAVTASHAAAVEAARVRAADEAEETSGGGATTGGAGATPTPGGGGCIVVGPGGCGGPIVVTALGSYVGSCPAGTMSHVFDARLRSGAVTLDYSFEYTYSIDGHGLAVMHCDPEGWGDSPAHGPGPLPDPVPQG
ncbi:hypothetical protein ACFVTX_16735 [Agromyces sp. NPDC058136]|uniref:hypothetical protein n=1 Tax=Agromyces sp. NPDC058136 TaxID=3346354 RepID=UPI0036D98013